MRTGCPKACAAGVLNEPRLKRRADDAVQPSLFGVLGILNYRIVYRSVYQQLFLHPLLACGGELSYRYQKRSCSVRPCEAFNRRPHHINGACGVKIGHINADIAQNAHRLFNGVRYIVELEVKEDLMSPCLYFFYDIRTLGIKKLHTDFHKRLFLCEAAEKIERLRPAAEIACNNNILAHQSTTPIISLIAVMPSFSHSAGSASIIFLQANGSTRFAAPT